MRALAVVVFVVGLMMPLAAVPQAPSVPLGTGRPDIQGITRTQIRDDAKSTVTRVRFLPDALEPPHTHPYDVILVPLTDGKVDLAIGDMQISTLKAGEVQFIPKNTPHHLGNAGGTPFEIIAIGIK